jgi:hypothetical protein
MHNKPTLLLLMLSHNCRYEPPIPRNSPPVAGNIMWARQLLRRIESPMQRFAQNKVGRGIIWYPFAGWYAHKLLHMER